MSDDSEKDKRKRIIKMLRPSAAQLRAIGAIAVELNNFESQLFQLFAHHYERLGWGTSLPWHFYNLLQDNRRGAAISEIFKRLDTSDVCEHVQHALDYFNICNDNRNHIFHTPHMPFFIPRTLTLLKAVKADWGTINLVAIPDAQLREIAGKTLLGSNYAFKVLGFVKKRDMRTAYPAATMRHFPDTLPQKPSLPPKLNPFQSPRSQIFPESLLDELKQESEPH